MNNENTNRRKDKKMKEIRKDKKTKVTDNAIVKALLSESDPKRSGDFLIACSDKANEVEPRPNEDDMLVECWNNLLILTCHPYGILLTADIFSTDISSLRDFLSATIENTDRAITSVHSKSHRDDTLLTVCFSLRGIACSKKLSEP
jgi:hypothetical protein